MDAIENRLKIAGKIEVNESPLKKRERERIERNLENDYFIRSFTRKLVVFVVDTPSDHYQSSAGRLQGELAVFNHSIVTLSYQVCIIHHTLSLSLTHARTHARGRDYTEAIHTFHACREGISSEKTDLTAGATPAFSCKLC